MRLSGNTVLITGGTSGIGLELAKSLLKQGNKVIVTGRDEAKLKKTKESLPEIDWIQSDVSKLQDIENLFNRITTDFPETNILINNAGGSRPINLFKAAGDLAGLTEEIDSNLTGQIRMAVKFISHLEKKSSAAIVNVTSGLSFVPLPLMPVYCAAKAGIHSFTLSLRVQLKNTNIKVFELAPPTTRTPLIEKYNSED